MLSGTLGRFSFPNTAEERSSVLVLAMFFLTEHTEKEEFFGVQSLMKIFIKKLEIINLIESLIYGIEAFLRKSFNVPRDHISKQKATV